MKDRFGFDETKVTGTHFWSRPLIGRRLFFRHIASAVGGYMLLPERPGERLARAQSGPIGTAKNVIFILMNGGPSHVDTFDLKEGPWTPQTFQPTTFGDIRWPQGLFPRLAEQLDSIALLRSARSWVNVHDLGRIWAQIGRNPTQSQSKVAPHIGSVVAMELTPKSSPPPLPAFISLFPTNSEPGPGWLPPEFSQFQITPNGGGLGNTAHPAGQAAFDRRYNLLMRLDSDERKLSEIGPKSAEMESFNTGARALMYNPTVDRAFIFDAAERAAYGNSNFGNAAITARNMLRANLGPRFIQISIGGWDNHGNIYGNAFNAANANSLARQFDAGLGQLIADLKADGLLDETLIVALGEFGRTVGPLNAGAGRDHFQQQAVLFAGARVRGGRAIGATDSVGRVTTDPGWSRARDVRFEDIEATIYSALGIDWRTQRLDAPLGRFLYVPESDKDIYGPIHELWS
jgi:hypothetical protein